MKFEIEVSGKNEGTAEPWWVIIDPRQMMRPDCHTVAGMIEGPFFSQEEAETALKNRRYDYGPNAVVYCHSACNTIQYKQKYRESETQETAMIEVSAQDYAELMHQADSLADDYHKLKAERDRLREALERIANWPDLPDTYTPGEMQDIAWKALKGDTDAPI